MSRLIYRPWSTWTDGPPGEVSHNFKAGWDDTKQLLRVEVDRVSPDDTLIILQVKVNESDIRQDGFMRADRKVQDDGVIVSFVSKYGPLRYATNTFTGGYWRGLTGWQANVRAIALGLSDLRRLDRYGIARRGEQYIGFGALPPGRPMGAAKMSKDEAMRLLEDEAGLQPGVVSKHYGDHSFNAHVTVAYRRAAKKHHPDTGGDAMMFASVTEARDLLIGATP